MAQRRQTPQQKFAKIKQDHLKKVGGQSSLFPQTSAPERATKKALQAWQSELRRLERTLQERQEFLSAYEQRLIEREQQLEREIANFEEWREDYGFDECEGYECEAEFRGQCDCDHSDAEDGCECATCQFYNQTKSKRATIIPDQQQVLLKGDEVDWLNNLFTLKDKRKK